MSDHKAYLKALGIPKWHLKSSVNETADQEAVINTINKAMVPIVNDAPPVVCPSINEHKDINHCTKCALHESRTRVVVGRGALNAPIMVICEAPTFDEDVAGRSLVDKAYDLFVRMMACIDLKEEQFYITPYVKCRSKGAKDPLPAEIEACFEHLKAEIKTINPKLIIILGRNPARFLLKTDQAFDDLRGRLHTLNINDDLFPAMTTYAPNLLLRMPREKIKVWQDLKSIHKELALL